MFFFSSISVFIILCIWIPVFCLTSNSFRTRRFGNRSPRGKKINNLYVKSWVPLPSKKLNFKKCQLEKPYFFARLWPNVKSMSHYMLDGIHMKEFNSNTAFSVIWCQSLSSLPHLCSVGIRNIVDKNTSKFLCKGQSSSTADNAIGVWNVVIITMCCADMLSWPWFVISHDHQSHSKVLNIHILLCVFNLVDSLASNYRSHAFFSNNWCYILHFSFEQFGKPNMINPDIQRDVAEMLLTGPKCAVDNTLRPEFIRLAPPLHIAEDEVKKNVLHFNISLVFL